MLVATGTCFNGLIWLQYKESLHELRQKAAEEMETAKRRDHLEWVNVDPASIKPKIEV